MALLIKKLVVLQGHYKVQCFMSTEYCVLDMCKISSNSSFLFIDDSFKVYCLIGMTLSIKKLVVLQGHCKEHCFVSTEYCVLDK